MNNPPPLGPFTLMVGVLLWGMIWAFVAGVIWERDRWQQ